MAVIGIDFGNLNCVISQAGRGGVDVLLNGASKRQNACVVSLQGKQRFMGDDASAIARSNYKNTALNMKRLIGRLFSEPEVQEEIASQPLKFVELEDGTTGVQVSYNDKPTVLSMEQVTAMMLTKLMQITEASAGVKVIDAVVSIPPYFTDRQRRAMMNACAIADLNCLRLMHDGTASALAYGIFKSAKGQFDSEKPSKVLFIDLGHSNYSVTAASFVTGKLAVQASTHDRQLGGRDFDVLIAKHMAAEFKAKHGDDPWENPKVRMKLLVAAEKAKKTLSPAGVTETPISCECLMNDIDFFLKLTIEEFKSAAESLLARLEAPIHAALAQSGFAPDEISSVEIVGGSTRIGFVKDRLTAILAGAGVPLDPSANNSGLSTTMNADEAVSRGCALQAAILSTRFKVKEFSIVDCVSHSVKVAWDDGVPPSLGTGEDDAAPAAALPNDVVLFRQNDMTPDLRHLIFQRGHPFTVAATYDGEALASLPPGSDAAIGSFTVETPDAGAGAVPQIRVNIKHDIHGILGVSSAQIMEEIPEAEGKEDAGTSAEDAKKMDVEGADNDEGAAGEGKEAQEPPQKKKRFRKVDVKCTAAVPGMSAERLKSAQDQELAMQQLDRQVIETNDAKNEVESYIYSMRDEIVGALRPFCTDEEKATVEKALADGEDWLYYGDGYDTEKAVYLDKLKELQTTAAPTVARERESRNREPCVAALKRSLTDYTDWLAASTADEKYSHITDEERGVVRAAIKEHEDWLFDMLEKQATLAANQDPVLLTADIGQHHRDFVDKAKPVVNRPKPAPKPEEKPPAPADAGQEGAADKAGDKDAAEEPAKEDAAGAAGEGKEPEGADRMETEEK